MKIRFISILTAAVLLLTLCACGNGDISVSSDNESSISSEQESSIVSETEKSSVTSEQDKSSATVSKKSSKSSSKVNSKVSSKSESKFSGKNPNMEYCPHSVLDEFDDETMMVNGVYEKNLVIALLQDIERYWVSDHHAVIFKNGVEITDGYLEQGMVVKVYHFDELYGEYVIDKLRVPSP